MRIGLRLFYNASWMGGVHYVLNIARMLRALPADERPEIVFLTSAPAAEAIARDHADLADEIADFHRAGELNLDFVYPATQLPEAPFDCAWGGWIPDWQCQHYPELFPPEERDRRFLQYRELARGPAICAFSSQQAIDDTAKLFPDFPRDHWRVFHFPAVFDDATWSSPQAELSTVRERFKIPERYLIVCNQFWRHKNHLLIAEALAAQPDLDVHVVMTGAIEDTRWPDYAKRMRELLANPEVARRVTITDRVSRDDQLSLLLAASGYIQPSLFEGWSTFVEEARAIGLPGLLSDIPVHREQSPPGAQFFDPEDADALARALAEFCRDTPKRPALEQARQRQATYILDCARVFIQMATDAARIYEPGAHGTIGIYARAIPRLHATIDAEDHCSQESFDRWLANVRLSLRANPEVLARLAGLITADGSDFAPQAQNLLVLATLAKCPAEIRQRFLDYRPDDTPGYAEAVQIAQSKLDGADTKAKLAVQNTLFRIQDYVRRKLTG